MPLRSGFSLSNQNSVSRPPSRSPCNQNGHGTTQKWKVNPKLPNLIHRF